MTQSCAIILAAGQGKRMKSDTPKPMFKVLGEPMLDWVTKACEKAGIEKLCIVTGFNSEIVEKHLNGRYTTVLQADRLGTGHAVMQCTDFIFENKGSNILVLYGDAPFIDSDTITSSLELHLSQANAVTVITAEVSDAYGYGRIIRNENGGVCAIVEQRDADENQRRINEINSGVYWFNADALLGALEELKPANSQGEYYLTDTIGILIKSGLNAGAYKTKNPHTVLGANDRKGLLELNEIARKEVIEKQLENGVEFICTDGIIIERDVIIGAGTQILPGTILRGQTVIGEGCVIGPNCIIENTSVGSCTKLNNVQAYDSIIEDNVKIGPFVHIRPDSHIKSCVKIGDFVEIKNSTIGEKTAVAHLTYVGDSDVGRSVNFGCGCVTVNYDGAKKARTTVGDNAFIGCNTNLIAPVKVGEGAYTAAGTTVTKDVPDNALAIERAEFKIKDGFALRKLRDKNK